MSFMTATGYWSSSVQKEGIEKLFASNEVKDSMRIEIVKNVGVSPSFKSIYLSSNEFKFKVLHGSGHFAVHLNNSDLAEINERDGYITIIPKKEGSLEI